MYRRTFKILLFVFLIFIIPQIARAGFLDDVAYCTINGSCNFTDIAVAFNSLIRLLLGGFGAIALIYFVWGGSRWLISGGSMEKVSEGKNIMINTVFAMILTFGSYLLVSFFINDVLNVQPEFRINSGQFTSCFEAARGEACGESRQCAGNLDSTHIHADLSGKCLDACQVQTLDNPVLGRCVDTIPSGWQPVLGVSLCPGNKQCALAPNS